MSSDRQLNYVNNLQNRDQKLYYVDDASELNSIDLKENDKIYAINDNKLFQMEIVDQDEELSGSIVSFNGRNNTKIKSVVANIEPVQDLHGYSNPWPAGGGKNKLPPGQTQTVNGITLTVQDDGSYIATGTATGTATITLGTLTLQAGNYILNGLPERGRLNSTYRYLLEVDGTPTNYYELENAFTLSEASTIVVKLQFFTNYSASNVKFEPMIRLATETDAAFVPYSNICPISGWTGMTLTRTGKNLLNPDFSAWSTNRNYLYINNVVPDGQIARFTFVEKDSTISLENINIGFTASDLSKGKTAIEYTWSMQNGSVLYNASNISRQSHITCCNVFVYPNTQVAFNKIFARFDVMVELGSTATAYEPYTGNQIPINWQSEAGTVYGGTLDVTTGLLTVNRGFKVYDGSEDERISFYSGKRFILGCDNYSSPAANVKDSIISNRLITVAKTTQGAVVGLISGSDPVRQEFMINIGLNTVPEVRSWLADNPLQVSYPLSSTVTYQLTPQKVKTLLGTNNIWSSTGDITVKIAEKGITAFELEPHT